MKYTPTPKFPKQGRITSTEYQRINEIEIVKENVKEAKSIRCFNLNERANHLGKDEDEALMTHTILQVDTVEKLKRVSFQIIPDHTLPPQSPLYCIRIAKL